MELIDTHAHLNFESFEPDREEVIARFFNQEGKSIINVGTDLKASKESILLANKFDSIYATVGIHPTDSRETDIDSAMKEMAQLIENKKIVAVGECGLDFYREEDTFERERQIKLFEAQVKIAQKKNLPIIVHSRESWKETLKVIKTTGQKKGVFHSWTYSPEVTREALKETDFYFAFNGIITFKNAFELLDSVKIVPIERMLTETDCPFLTPVPHRGLRNEPGFVTLVASTIAALKGIPSEEVAQTTTHNAETLFNL